MRNLGKVNLQKLINDLYIALEDDDTAKLNAFCKKILKIDARNPHVYLCKAFSKCGLSRIEKLNSEFLSYDLMVDNDYQRFLNYADNELRAEVEEKVKGKLYLSVVEKFNTGFSVLNTSSLNDRKKVEYLDNLAYSWKFLAEDFAKLEPYKESSEYGLKCFERYRENKKKAEALYATIRKRYERNRHRRNIILKIGVIVCLFCPFFLIFLVPYWWYSDN